MTTTIQTQLDDLGDGSPAWPWYGKLALWSVLIFFIAVPSCTVLTGIDDASVEAAKAEYLKVKYIGEAAAAQDKLALEKQRLETLARLISENGYGPVAARCAVSGWDGKGDRAICEAAEALHAAKRP